MPTEWLRYDEAGRWLGDYTAGGQAIRQALWLDDLPVGLLVGAGQQQKLYYIQPDALGTPRVVIDPDRDVAVWRWELQGEAFGADAPQQDPDNDGATFVFDMRFPGQRYDAATGINYNYFRDYDPSTGRYVQSDPIGLNGGVSTYGYVGGNPFVSIDFFGLTELNLFSLSDGNFYQNAMRFQSPAGVYTVAGHGNPWEMRDAENRTVTPETLRDMLVKDNRFKKAKAVFLASCNTGRDETSFAQKLANLIGKPVVGPSNFVYFPDSGRIYLASKDGTTGLRIPGTVGHGSWNIFLPTRKPTGK